MTSGDGFDFRQPFKSLPRVVTSPGIISDPDWDTISDGDSVGSTSSTERKIIVANFLPLNCTRDETGKLSFSLDHDDSCNLKMVFQMRLMLCMWAV